MKNTPFSLLALIRSAARGLLLFLLAVSAQAATPVALAKEGEIFPLSSYIDFLPDHEGISKERLLAGDYNADFRRYDDKSINASNVWLRMRISNGSRSERLVLSVGDVLYAEAELLYAKSTADGTQAASMKAGMRQPYDKKTWRYHDIAFPLVIPPDTSQLVYLRLESPFFIMLDPYVADEMSYSLHQSTQASWGHLMVGVMLGILLFLVIIALYVRDISEVRYCIAFVGISFLVLIFGRGYIFMLLPHSAWLNLHLYPLLFSAQSFTYLAFSRRHFRTQFDFPVTDKILGGCEYFCIAQFFAALFMPLEWSVLMVGGVSFVLLIALCASSVYVWANSRRSLTIYVLGTLVFLIACLLALSENIGLLNLGGVTRHAYEAGLCFQASLFALGLAEKMNNYQRDETRLAVQAAEAVAESRAKSSFLAKMSHELRTPMNGLLGMLQLLETTALDNQQKHYMQVMKNSGRMLLGVIDDVLDYSRIAAGKLKIETADYNLTELLGSLEAMFTLAAHQKNLQLRFHNSSTNIHCVRGDAGRLRQIIINLVSNAIKFTPNGSVTVRVFVEKSNSKEWLLHGEVEDTGIGISNDQINLLFSEYSQANNTQGYGSSGLGLVICKQLAEMMGGDIHVESAPGYGSLFRFHLRVTPPKETTTENATLIPDFNVMPTHSTLNKKILVAEDNDINRQVIIGLLTRLGYQAEWVANGAAAVAKVCTAELTWDLVLMDIEMPVLDGMAAAVQIRNWEATECRDATPIVALTAHAIHGYEEKFLQAGMDGQLIKPIDLHELQRLLDKWLSTVDA